VHDALQAEAAASPAGLRSMVKFMGYKQSPSGHRFPKAGSSHHGYCTCVLVFFGGAGNFLEHFSRTVNVRC
jgi:hypothetical protein